MLRIIKNNPTTFTLIVLNVLAFIGCYLWIGTFDTREWNYGLLNLGASFGPYILGTQWYRVFTHMFLHANLFHLAVNMYGLFAVGTSIEALTGRKKFIAVYFLGGIAAALTSVQYGLFAIGVGASGAIFGLFGFALVVTIHLSRQRGISILPILLNFGLFLGINLLIAEALHADTPAHMGGLCAGIIMGIGTAALPGQFKSLKTEVAVLAVLIVAYIIFPRDQVLYYNFFQKMLKLEERERIQVAQNLTDLEYYELFKENIGAWDSVSVMMDKIASVRAELMQDTFRLRRYISLRRLENVFRCSLIERESYIYFDSIAWASDSSQSLFPLDYNLNFNLAGADTSRQEPPQQMIRIAYDAEWVEIPETYAVPSYFRIGHRDSLGRWQGRVTDFYANGDIQMKGMYKDDLRNGVFIYYSDHGTYESAGRYEKDSPVGKWESFHYSGGLKSEEFYRDRYFLASWWDSTGVRQVREGNGKVEVLYPNGVPKITGEYKDGLREGYWYGKFDNGDIHFEEHYYHGRLEKGRSTDPSGQLYTYDASSLYPLPVGGYDKFNSYVRESASKVSTGNSLQTVRISFRVTRTGLLTEFKVEKSVSPELNELARLIVQDGPAWMPAHEFGYRPVDGFARVEVTFGMESQ